MAPGSQNYPVGDDSRGWISGPMGGPLPAPRGPFEHESEVRDLPAVRAVYEAYRASPGVGKMAPLNMELLEQACADAGVDLGSFDRQILAWLAGWEPSTVAVVCGLIRRAAQP